MSSSPKASHAHAVPLDYSFMGLATLSDMALHDPVGGKKKASASHDGASAAKRTASSSANGEGNQGSDAAASVTTTKQAKPASVALRANNNKISNLDDMRDALHTVFDDPSKLQWLDLSGNVLASISRSTFASYPDIFTLHLHGNKLRKYADIDNLALSLVKLHSLTLHGNPVEEKKHYRNYVIASFPKLMQLDFSSITKGDREKANTWAKIYQNALRSPKWNGNGGSDGKFGGGENGDQDS